LTSKNPFKIFDERLQDILDKQFSTLNMARTALIKRLEFDIQNIKDSISYLNSIRTFTFTNNLSTMNESTTLTVIFLLIIYGISIPIVYLFSSMYMQNDYRSELRSEIYAVIMAIFSPITILVFLGACLREYYSNEN
jgi:hypothetical protein